MQILGISIKKILSEIKNPVKGQLEINSGLDLIDVKKDVLEPTKQPIIIIDFDFTINYKPDKAKIELSGSLVLLDNENKTEEIMETWKKKKLPENIKTAVLNFILKKCNLKSLEIEDYMGLPLHVPFPKLGLSKEKIQNSERKNPKTTNYTG